MIQEEYKTVRDGGAVKNGVFHFAKAVLTCLAASAVMFVIAALLLTYTPLPETLIAFIVILTTVFSVLIGAASAARSAKSKGWLTGALTGILYSVVLYFAESLAGDGFHFNGYMAVIALISLFSGAAGGILGINLSDKRKR